MAGALLWLGLLAPQAAFACGGDLLARIEVQPGLLVGQPGTTLSLDVHAEACLSIDFPRQDLRHGRIRVAMDATEHQALLAALDASLVAPPASVTEGEGGAVWRSDPQHVRVWRVRGKQQAGDHTAWQVPSAPAEVIAKSAGDARLRLHQRIQELVARQPLP